MLSSKTQVELMGVAHELADAARLVTLGYFRGAGLETENKDQSGFDPVTQADRMAEARMREILAKRRPQDGILGEEMGQQAGDSGLIWVLDPIDGTRAFITGAATWGVLVAVGDDTGPLYGIVDQPYMQERFEGGFGRAALHNMRGETALRTKKARPLADCYIMTTFPEVGNKDEEAAFRRVAQSCRLTRYSNDCYAYALLAAGHIDLVIEAGLKAYDIQAPMAVVQAAGGIVTDWQGGPCYQGGQVIAASCVEVHRAALALLNKVC